MPTSGQFVAVYMNDKAGIFSAIYKWKKGVLYRYTNPEKCLPLCFTECDDIWHETYYLKTHCATFFIAD